MTAGPRILVGGLFHEGHSFSSLTTDWANLTVSRGTDLTAMALTSGSILGGAVRALTEAGAEVIGTVSATAPPGGPIIDAVYRDLRDELVKAVRSTRPDGVFLELHGATAIEGLDDGEGDLLQAIRTALPPGKPIATALDLHAHPTPAMLSAADVCIACKENPHSDYADAGAKAARMLLSRVAGRPRPVTAAVWLPLILGHRLETADGPLADVHARCRDLEARMPDILDISIYNTTAYLDASGAGQCVTVTTASDVAAAAAAATELAAALWDRRDAFGSALTPLNDALSLAASAERNGEPLVLGDHGDRVLAGTPGDSTLILQTLLTDWPRLRAAIPVTDPDAVTAATASGIGSVVRLPVGGRLSAGGQAAEADWRVVRRGNGRFVQQGPFHAGMPADLGETVVLEAGNVTAIVTTLPGCTQDPQAFLSNGVDPRDYDIVVSKSGYHFRLSFAGTGPCMVVDTPGLSNYRPGLFAYRRRRPCYPEDRIDMPPLTVMRFGGNATIAAPQRVP